MTLQRAAEQPTLVVIDLQEIFRSSDSQWAVDGFDAAARNAALLVDEFAGSVIWTRFVRDPAEQGAWRAYYDRWAACREEPDSPVWDLVLPAGEDDAVLTVPTFSKWGEELASLSIGSNDLVVCGVATDCCVLSTVLAAVDAGKRVTVVTDACAGVSIEAHDHALTLLALLSPMVRLAETAQLLSSRI